MRRKPINDDDLDPNQLKDGESLHVPMRFCDALSRSVAKHVHQASKREHITDAEGHGGLALNRPGYRIQSGGNAGDALVRDGAQREAQRAYDAWEKYAANAWKVGDDVLDEDDDDAIEEATKAAKSADCYQEYEAEIRDSWRRGNHE